MGLAGFMEFMGFVGFVGFIESMEFIRLTAPFQVGDEARWLLGYHLQPFINSIVSLL